MSFLRPFDPGPLAPLYRPLSHGGWTLARLDGRNIPCHGYWSAQWAVSRPWYLSRGDEGWMSLMPLEVESQGLAADCAHGEVAVLGLGLGWLAAICALRPEVERVTVVELDPSLIAFHRELALFERLPDRAGSKVSIIQGNAFDWRPASAPDVALIDIWQPLIGDNRVGEMQRIHASLRAGSVHFWGQELELARHAAAAGRRLDDAGIAATVAEFAQPLAGPSLPGYAAKVRDAARNWMGDAWLPGTSQPVDLGEPA